MMSEKERKKEKEMVAQNRVLVENMSHLVSDRKNLINKLWIMSAHCGAECTSEGQWHKDSLVHT